MKIYYALYLQVLITSTMFPLAMLFRASYESSCITLKARVMHLWLGNQSHSYPYLKAVGKLKKFVILVNFYCNITLSAAGRLQLDIELHNVPVALVGSDLHPHSVVYFVDVIHKACWAADSIREISIPAVICSPCYMARPLKERKIEECHFWKCHIWIYQYLNKSTQHS